MTLLLSEEKSDSVFNFTPQIRDLLVWSASFPTSDGARRNRLNETVHGVQQLLLLLLQDGVVGGDSDKLLLHLANDGRLPQDQSLQLLLLLSQRLHIHLLLLLHVDQFFLQDAVKTKRCQKMSPVFNRRGWWHKDILLGFVFQLVDFICLDDELLFQFVGWQRIFKKSPFKASCVMNHLIAHEKAQSYFWAVNSQIYNLIIFFFNIINLVDWFILELTVHQLYCSSINIWVQRTQGTEKN